MHQHRDDTRTQGSNVSNEGRTPQTESLPDALEKVPGESPTEKTENSENIEETVEKASVAKNSFIMFMGTFVSRILGLVRSPIMLGAVVGLTTPAGNAFGVANKLPNLIYMIIAGGLINAVLVPAIVRATEKGEKEGEAFINKLLTLAIVALGSLTIVITLASPFVVKIMAATMSDDWYRLTVAWAYWCLPQVFFYGMYTVLGQILNAKENFGPYMWAPVANNVVAILGMVGILYICGPVTAQDAVDAQQWTSMRVALLGGVSTLGIVVQALILLWPMKRIGIRYRPDFRWRGSGLGSAGKASWWVFLMMIISIVPTALDSNVAAGASDRALHAGMDMEKIAGNFAYDTAYTIYSIPTSLFVVSVATAVFTRISRAAAQGNIDRLKADVTRTVKLVSAIMFLCATAMVVLCVPISRLFALSSSAEEAATLGYVVCSMSFGLFWIGMFSVLNRVYYAFEDTRGAFFITLPFQIVGSFISIGCLYLPPQWAVIGVGITMSLSNFLAALLMFIGLNKRVGGWDKKGLISYHAKLYIVIVCAGGAGYFATRMIGPLFGLMSRDTALIQCICGGSAIVVVYFALAYVLKIEEILRLIHPVARIVRKVVRR
ncbi:murein biosynthesis integral membrane protein MurJ [Actinotignum urinale]|uniref:Murein biosynthesis integral membrane protein MurJ n=1 Tax=Actinotignum urinale TaxID=190146 RepID=A0AAW9HYJ9_9ACTO|nr:murein biosynthesis integral membrane protein MurJ [Actinotignum urinale]MDY5154901.1 murein biosynthesis integral membrane protein MurJ [Actinotignum urinale]